MESLANELLLDVFGYFSSIDVLRAFYNLNSRFNELLSLHFQSYSFDLRSISLTDVNWIYREYLPHRTQYVKSLILSNNDDTPQAIDLFFQHIPTLHSFQSLQSLRILDLCSSEIMIEIMYQLEYLSNLTHLTLAGCYLKFNPMRIQQFIDRIWSLSNLIYCYLNIHFGESNTVIPTVMSRSMKYLFIWGLDHNQREIDALFRQTPALEHLSILFNNDDRTDDVQPPISMVKKLKLGLSIIDENSLPRFLQRTPNLSQLTLDISSSHIERVDQILNGYQWEAIIRNRLPHLEIFRFRMDFKLLNINNFAPPIDEFIKSFQTFYWLKEHRWFIGCHWNLNNIFLYTLPYIFPDMNFDHSMQFKSTCADERLQRYFHHVNQLHYTNSSENLTVSSPLRFTKINDLSLDYPIDAKNLRSILPNLNWITSVHMSMNDSPILITSLRLLINEISHFDSLTLVSGKLMHMKELQNVPVHRLTFYRHHFTHEDISTLFAIQCETLCINIQTRNLIFDLVTNMINLRTLIIHCNDDQFSETKEDEFLIWLKDQLPSTYLISRDSLFSSDVRIWIR